MATPMRFNLPTPLEYFAALVADDSQINLLEAAACIAQDEFPQLDVQAVVDEVDKLGDRLLRRLPVDAAAGHRVRALTRYFHAELGFAGNVNNYYDSGNSYLHHVLATRRGIPISLAVILLELAGHLGLRALGVSFPGHFLVKMRVGANELLLDPFTGESLSRSRLDEILQSYRQASGLGAEAEMPLEYFLQPASKRQILARMLRNLKEIHRQAQDWPRLLAVQQRLVLLLPQDLQERRDRGLVLEALGHWPAAAADLTHYLSAQGEGDSSTEDLRARLERLRGSGLPPLH